MVIFLIGFMGCGKSTVGRRVATRLGYDFIDLDRQIERLGGGTVSEIFRLQGEEQFRRLESDALNALPDYGNLIVAAGGGTPCFGNNLEMMQRKGTAVYFKMSPETLFGRLVKGRAKRPKLAGMDDGQLKNYIEATLAEREEFYSKASVIIDCDMVDDEYIVSHLVFYINQKQDTI